MKKLIFSVLASTMMLTGCVELQNAILEKGLDYVKVETRQGGHEWITKEEFEKREKARLQKIEKQRQEEQRKLFEQEERERKLKENTRQCFLTLGSDRIKLVKHGTLAEIFSMPGSLQIGDAYRTKEHFFVHQVVPGGVLAIVGYPQYQVFIKTNRPLADGSPLPNLWVVFEGKTYKYRTVLGATKTVYWFDEITDDEYMLMNCLTTCGAVPER